MIRRPIRFFWHLVMPITVGGGLSYLLTSNAKDVYEGLVLPGFAPPSYVFPIVWTILYIMMGFAAYLVDTSDYLRKKNTLDVYYLQLLLNFLWSIIFFKFNAYILAFIVGISLLALIIVCVVNFYKANRLAGWLLVPYAAWVAFAMVLNFAVIILN